ncbi:MAG TPA: cytochrome C [Bradyrhizobium sp.]|uniref:cytochrome C n=1 Tax=Bradyrhizobium sp. TaxID=376 RepID=UPI002D7EEE5C|nr:cytochrome C [Bradyrhizobium sp.]HET7887827.1 cytochrome C [Bradyrhizobium sp.]
MSLIMNFLNRPALVLGGLGLMLGSGFLLGPSALAQNIDEGKNAPQLFAGSCVTCHKSPNNLARGRMTPTLLLFLQDHYTTSTSAAWALSSYLASVDTSGRSKGAKSSSTKKRNPRPPAAVPN